MTNSFFSKRFAYPCIVVAGLLVGASLHWLPLSRVISADQSSSVAARRVDPSVIRPIGIIQPGTIDESIDIASDVRRNPDERNRHFDLIVHSEDQQRAAEVFIAIANAQDDSDMCRSWAVQHLGMMIDRGRGRNVRPLVLNGLRALSAAPEGSLIRRESLFALLNAGDNEDLARITQLTKDRIASSTPDLDLYIRFAGMLRMTECAALIRPFLNSSNWAVRMSAKETISILDQGGVL